MRILAIYSDTDEPAGARWEQIDVSNEEGYWKLSKLLAGSHIEEVRLVGDHPASIALARTLVVAGQFVRRRASSPEGRLKKPGDEEYPFLDPYIYICPDPDLAAFD